MPSLSPRRYRHISILPYWFVHYAGRWYKTTAVIKPAKCEMPEMSTNISGVPCVSSLETIPRQSERSIKSASWKPARYALMAMADFAVVSITV